MIINSISEIMERDLLKVAAELNQYENENDIWVKKGLVSNSAGNLALHLIGNLNHFVGFALGNTGYIRDRDSEFSTTFCPREELVLNIHKTITVVKESLSKVNDEKLYTTFPIKKNDETVTVEHILLHMLVHLGYHLGQINYHRRLIAEESK
ncbi:MAG: DinB family protein [Melioribacteraceae bacterium]